MVRYLDDEHLLIDGRTISLDNDLDTGEPIRMWHVVSLSEISTDVLLNFARLLRAKNLPEFLGVYLPPKSKYKGLGTRVAIVLKYVHPFKLGSLERYCVSLCSWNFDVEMDPHHRDVRWNFNGIEYFKYEHPRHADIALSPLDNESYQETLAIIRQRRYLNHAKIDLRPLHKYFTSDDWEQFCFGLYYSGALLVFYSLEDSLDETFENADGNIAHYGVLPDFLRIEIIITKDSEVALELGLKIIDDIYTWIHNFTEETLLFHEEQLLETGAGSSKITLNPEEESNLVDIVMGTMRDETSLRRNRLKRSYR